MNKGYKNMNIVVSPMAKKDDQMTKERYSKGKMNALIYV